MKKIIYSALALTALVSAVSCTNNDDFVETPIDPSAKEMISFSLSDGSQSTRAGFTESATRIVARIQSDDRHSSGPGAAKYTRVVATANKDEMPRTGDDAVTDEAAYSTVNTNDDPRYWDDAYGRFGQLSVYAIAIANKNDATLLPLSYMYDGAGTKSGATNTTWGTSSAADDHVADNTISFSVETTGQTTSTIANQDLVYSNNIQADASLGKDGVYRYNFSSNNYPAETGLTTHTSGRMIFAQNGVAVTAEPTDAPGKFDKGHLVFKHALSRITVTIKEGAGFSTSSTADFKFADGTNIKLLKMNTTGTLDVKTGTWTHGTATAISKMAPEATYTDARGTYLAQMLPDYTFTDGNTTNVMEFTIDDNTYYITQDMIFDALTYDANGNGTKDTGDGDLVGTTDAIKMEQGKNYKFTITVDKTKIVALTATLAEWVDVTAGEFNLNNSHIAVTTKTFTDATACSDFNLYRIGETLDKIYTDDSYTATNFSGDYKGNGIATKNLMKDASNNDIAGVWETEWYYENNKTAYHLRTLNNLASDETGTNSDDGSENVTTASDKSYFTMRSGAQATQDYHWGAPMVSAADLKYDLTNGYKNNIHKGFVAPKNGTSNTINITEIHMMSNVNVRLVTDSVSYVENGNTKYKVGPAGVNLENAQITLTRFAKTGTVDMGTGLVSPNFNAASSHSLDGDNDCAKITAPAFTGTCWWLHSKSIKASTDWYTYAVVPQALQRKADPTEADCVGLTIRTTDNNEYYVIKDLASILATSVSDTRNQAVNAKIERWFPGHTYNYTIKITKKGIEAITCTVAKWVDVNAAEKHITLEN